MSCGIEKPREIRVTRFVSPSNFHFYYFNDKKSYSYVKEDEEKLREIAKKRGRREEFKPESGSICGFFQSGWKKWVRVKVESISGKFFEVFLLDHGHMRSTQDLTLFMPIPECLKHSSKYLKRGSLGLSPAEKVLDRNSMEKVVRPVEFWSPKATKFVESYVKSQNYKVHFERFGKTSEGTEVGNLLVSEKGKLLNINETLVRDELALKKELELMEDDDSSEISSNFEKIFSKAVPEGEKFVKSKSPITIKTFPAGIDVNAHEKHEEKGNQEKQEAQKSGKSGTSSSKYNFSFMKECLSRQKNQGKEAATIASLPSADSSLLIPSPDSSQIVETTPEKPITSPKTSYPVANNPFKSQVTQSSTGAVPKVPANPPPESFIQPRKIATKSPPPVPSRSNPQRPKTDIPAPNPTDVFVAGPALKFPVQNINSAAFSSQAKKILINNFNELKKVQKHAFPHLLEGRSMIIVSGDKREATNSYIPAALDKISAKDDSQKLIGPRVIILVTSSDEVDRVSKLISRIFQRLEVIGCFGANMKILDLMNSCDVMVTTPESMTRHLNAPLKIFDKNQIEVVVLDGFEEISDEVKHIFKKISRTWLDAAGPTQVVVTSPMAVKGFHIKDPVVYIEDFIEAAVFVRCEFVLKSFGSYDEKTEKLKEILKDEKYKLEKTVVVTSQDDVSKLAENLRKSKFFVTLHTGNGNDRLIWEKQSRGNFSLLVTSDLSLNNLGLKSAKNMIHFSIPSKSNIFKQRFSALLESFYLHFEKKSSETQPSTCIFIEDENLSMFKWLMEFLEKRKLIVIPEELKKNLQKIEDHDESEKCLQKIPICSQIVQSGECRKSICNQRHLLTETDKSSLLEKISAEKTILFDLITVESPTSFIVKITSNFENGKWISWKEKIDQTEIFISVELQQYFETGIREKCGSVERGEVYAVFDEKTKLWQRCRYEDKISSDVLQLYLIDVGRSLPCSSSKLFKLPESSKNHDPLVAKLQIIDLAPVDKDFSIWKHDEATQEFLSDLRKMAEDENLCFGAKIQFGIQDVLFAKSFEAKDKKFGATKFQLTKNLKKEICEVDLEISEKLKKLLKNGNLLENYEEALDEAKSLEKSEKMEPENRDVPIAKSKKPENLKETWKQLSWNSWYDINVMKFEDPGSIFVTLDSSSKRLRESLQKAPEKALTSFEVGKLCGVKTDEIRRGKILSSDENCEILLVDSGEVISCEKSDLIELPSDSWKIPCQAIHCKMLGIQPKFKLKLWAPLQREKAQKIIESFDEPLKLWVQQENNGKNKFGSLGMKSYEVFLVDPSGKTFLDDIAVQLGLDRVEVTKPDLEKLESRHEEQIDSGNVSDDIGPDQMECVMELIKKIYTKKEFQEPENSDFENPDSPMEEEKFSFSPENAQKFRKSPSQNAEKFPKSVQSNFEFIHKHPHMKWRDEGPVVKIVISATDLKDFALKIDSTFMKITITYPAEKIEQTLVNFYDVIDPKLSSFDHLGNNIVVRLVKVKFHEKWPRLTESKEKSQFIKFDVGVAKEEESEIESESSSRSNQRPSEESEEEGCSEDSDIDDLKW